MPTASVQWRSSLHLQRTISDISIILLQFQNPIPHIVRLRRFNPPLLILPTNPSPSFIRSILSRTKSNPDQSLHFFNFAQSNLNFKPDINTTLTLLNTLIHHQRHHRTACQLIKPFLISHSSQSITDSVLRISDSVENLLDFIVNSYSDVNSITDAIHVFNVIRRIGRSLSTRTCNALLQAFCVSGNTPGIDYRRSFAAALRAGVDPDFRTWELLTRLLCIEGKTERAEVILNLGLCGPVMYDLVVDCYAKKGDFLAAIRILSGVQEKKGLQPKFGMYSSILDGGCRFNDVRIVRPVLKEMVVKELLPTVPGLDYDWTIRRLCELEKTFAAEMFFQKALNENVTLHKRSYACILMALSKGERLQQAMQVYQNMLEMRIDMEPDCMNTFLSGICRGEPSPEVDTVLKDAAERGIVPQVADLSEYIDSQCRRGRWSVVSDLLHVALDRNILPEASCCHSLMVYLCANQFVESAIQLHDKIKKFGGLLNITSYNMLLRSLLKESRVNEAIEVFDYMRDLNCVTCESFVIMVGSLCRHKDLRKAMNLHDEMLKLGLKPDDCTYKWLISGFS